MRELEVRSSCLKSQQGGVYLWSELGQVTDMPEASSYNICCLELAHYSLQTTLALGFQMCHQVKDLSMSSQDFANLKGHGASEKILGTKLKVSHYSSVLKTKSWAEWVCHSE